MKRILLVLLLGLMQLAPGPSMGAEEVQEQRGWLLLPILAYTPDTSVLLGASGLRFFSLDPESEPSVFSPVGIVSVKKQVLVFLGSNLEWGPNRAEIVPSYIRFPDKFFGIGRDVPEDAEEAYTPESFGVDLSWRREVLPDLRLGLAYEIRRHRLLEVEAGGMLDSGLVPGTEASTISTPGLVLDYDSRDGQWSPRHGLWLQSKIEFASDGVGSDFEFNRRKVDLRAYLPLGEKSVLAFQVMGTSLTDEPPFFALPTLGGQEGLRSYLQGRYRDRTMALGRLEWRTGERLGRFGGVLFAGIGDVAPDPGQLSLEAELWSVGGGLRYTLDPEQGVKLRLDVGVGNGDGGFYLSFGEAF